MSLIERIVICVLFGAVAVIAILGDQWKEQWYFILIPIVLDWGLGLVALILSFLLPPPKRGCSGARWKIKIVVRCDNTKFQLN